MFCGHCGRLLTDGVSFCGYCGKPLAVIRTYDRAQLKAAQETIFAREWNGFASSPLVLITVLLMAAYWVVDLYTGITAFPTLVRQMSVLMGDVLVVVFMVLAYSVSALNVLMLVGMYKVYRNAAENSNRPASDGLRLIRMSMIGYILGTAILLVLAYMPALRTMDSFGGAGPVLVVVMLIAGAVVGVFYWAVMRILKKAIDNVNYCQTDYGMLAGFGIVIIVMGSFSALGLLADFSVGSLLSAISTILTGCVMLSCRAALKRIGWQYYRLYR